MTTFLEVKFILQNASQQNLIFPLGPKCDSALPKNLSYQPVHTAKFTHIFHLYFTPAWFLHSKTFQCYPYINMKNLKSVGT